MITLYTIHCPKCNVLEKKMIQKGIEFTLVDDEDKVLQYGREHNIRSAPILDVDGEPMDFAMAIRFIDR